MISEQLIKFIDCKMMIKKSKFYLHQKYGSLCSTYVHTVAIQIKSYEQICSNNIDFQEYYNHTSKMLKKNQHINM